MGLYIKGAEIPKTCKDCRLFISCLHVPRWADAETLDNLKVQRADNCPLIEVPEPHGRLIDADALLDKLRPRGMQEDLWKESSSYKDIANAPTIIEGSE